MKENDIHRMVQLFGEIYSRVSSSPIAHTITLNHLDKELTVKLKGNDYLTFEDVSSYLEAKYRHTLPVVSTMFRNELLVKVKEAYNLWLTFREEIDRSLVS